MSEKEKPSNLSKKMAEITDVIGSILTKINVFSGIISMVSSIVGAFGDFVSDVIKNAPHAIGHGVNTRQNARTLHMDKAQYQKVRNVFQYQGLNEDEVNSMLAQFKAQSEYENSTLAKLFNQNGEVSNYGSLGERIKKFTELIETLPSKDQANMLDEVFGPGGYKLQPILGQGQEGFKAILKEVGEVPMLSNDNVASSEAASRAISEAATAWDAVLDKASITFVAPLKEWGAKFFAWSAKFVGSMLPNDDSYSTVTDIDEMRVIVQSLNDKKTELEKSAKGKFGWAWDYNNIEQSDVNGKLEDAQKRLTELETLQGRSNLGSSQSIKATNDPTINVVESPHQIAYREGLKLDAELEQGATLLKAFFDEVVPVTEQFGKLKGILSSLLTPEDMAALEAKTKEVAAKEGDATAQDFNGLIEMLKQLLEKVNVILDPETGLLSPKDDAIPQSAPATSGGNATGSGPSTVQQTQKKGEGIEAQLEAWDEIVRKFGENAVGAFQNMLESGEISIKGLTKMLVQMAKRAANFLKLGWPNSEKQVFCLF